MTLQDIQIEVAELTGLKLPTHESTINRKVLLALEDMDDHGNWHIADIPFEKTIASGSNKVSVREYNIFKPVSCVIDIGTDSYPLDYIDISDFDRYSADQSDTTDAPTRYTLGNGYLWVGPGLLSVSATVRGLFRRRLTVNDIPYLPASMIIDRVLMKTYKPGSPEHISAWSGWKDRVSNRPDKATAERRTGRAMDRQILENIDYMSTLT